MTTTQGANAEIEMRQLPLDFRHGGHTIRLRYLASDDGNALLEFGRRQPNEDLLFQERDITNVADIGDWIHESEAGRIRSVVAEENQQIIGYATIERGRLRWTRHVAEIRVMVDVSARRLGLGHILLGLAFEGALTDDVAKIIAQMTPDQVGARKIFERLGFVEDAVLTRHVASADGELHDLVVMRFDTKQRLICEECGQPVLTLIPMQGKQLCWACYEILDHELGAG